MTRLAIAPPSTHGGHSNATAISLVIEDQCMEFQRDEFDYSSNLSRSTCNWQLSLPILRSQRNNVKQSESSWRFNMYSFHYQQGAQSRAKAVFHKRVTSCENPDPSIVGRNRHNNGFSDATKKHGFGKQAVVLVLLSFSRSWKHLLRTGPDTALSLAIGCSSSRHNLSRTSSTVAGTRLSRIYKGNTADISNKERQ